jgi:hypothetical protein
MRGTLCSECSPDYTVPLTGGVCEPCPDQTINTIKLAGLTIAGALVITYFVWSTMDGKKRIIEKAKHKKASLFQYMYTPHLRGTDLFSFFLSA